LSLGLLSRTSRGVLLGVLVVAVLLPGAALAAPDARPHNYIVMLDTPDAGQTIRLSTRAGRQRMRQRAAIARAATRRLVRQYDVKARHRYTSAVAGFSARLTSKQAATLRRDYEVASVRQARRFRLAAEFVPAGVSRVKAAPASSPTPDADVDVAIIDTGIGPVGGNELNIAGGINCAADGLPPDQWQDLYEVAHGTHVAGTIGARDGNGVGVVGVVPGARLWSVRVFDASGWGDESTVLCGLDWVTSTHVPGAAPPGTQPIEVINMSIEGSRISATEECLPGDPDPIHVAVCAAYAAGITIVAAAGNGATDASGVVPAGYDQVITVGAITDLDGSGWGDASDGCAGEREDAYASYSNYGADVDILAPGTCVTSLRPSDSGDLTKQLTGTSMAAPHVSGAVARYLAGHPGTPPAMMRDLVRAAGRLDWEIRSDPMWSGVAEPDGPGRLLDVAALIGPPMLRVWLSIDRFNVGRGSSRRQVRVDVQRGGGYGGATRLSLGGLRRKVGSASFSRPGSYLVGLDGLGARLRLRIDPEARDGRRQLEVTAIGADGPAGSRALELVVDRTGPKVGDISPRILDRNAAMTAGGAARAVLEWTARDRLSGIRTSLLQVKTGGRAWRAVKSADGKARVTLQAGRADLFRVVATDSLGNASRSKAIPVEMVLRDSDAPEWRRPPVGWKARRTTGAYGGSLLMGTSKAKAVVTEFSGDGVALVAPIGPGRGTLRVRIDGRRWQPVDLDSPRSLQRRIVFSRRLPSGQHRLEVRGLQGRPAIDAVLFTR